MHWKTVAVTLQLCVLQRSYTPVLSLLLLLQLLLPLLLSLLLLLALLLSLLLLAQSNNSRQPCLVR
jgi:hypothetical protein